MSEKANINKVSYVVEYDGMTYRYALHSARRNRIIFPSQVLNVLEYCMFKKIKDGWKGPFRREDVKFSVDRLIGGVVDENWKDKHRFEEDMAACLEDYVKNLLED